MALELETGTGQGLSTHVLCVGVVRGCGGTYVSVPRSIVVLHSAHGILWPHIGYIVTP